MVLTSYTEMTSHAKMASHAGMASQTEAWSGYRNQDMGMGVRRRRERRQGARAPSLRTVRFLRLPSCALFCALVAVGVASRDTRTGARHPVTEPLTGSVHLGTEQSQSQSQSQSAAQLVPGHTASEPLRRSAFQEATLFRFGSHSGTGAILERLHRIFCWRKQSTKSTESMDKVVHVGDTASSRGERSLSSESFGGPRKLAGSSWEEVGALGQRLKAEAEGLTDSPLLQSPEGPRKALGSSWEEVGALGQRLKAEAGGGTDSALFGNSEGPRKAFGSSWEEVGGLGQRLKAEAEGVTESPLLGISKGTRKAFGSSWDEVGALGQRLKAKAGTGTTPSGTSATDSVGTGQTVGEVRNEGESAAQQGSGDPHEKLITGLEQPLSDLTTLQGTATDLSNSGQNPLTVTTSDEGTLNGLPRDQGTARVTPSEQVPLKVNPRAAGPNLNPNVTIPWCGKKKTWNVSTPYARFEMYGCLQVSSRSPRSRPSTFVLASDPCLGI